MPAPRGLGLEPSGFSHVLSARGLDVLDDALDQARRQMSKDPTEENIAHFSDLEDQYRRNGGYEAESVMAAWPPASASPRTPCSTTSSSCRGASGAGSTSSASSSRRPTP